MLLRHPSMIPLLAPPVSRYTHWLSLRYLEEFHEYEYMIQASRWNSFAVEICMFGLVFASFIASTDYGLATEFDVFAFLLASIWSMLAISRRFSQHEDPLRSKRMLEWVMGCTIVAGIYLHAAFSPCVTRWDNGAIFTDFTFKYAPMAHALSIMSGIIISHALHFHPVLKFLMVVWGTICTVAQPIFMFGMETELKIIVVATAAAFLTGYAFEAQLRDNFAMQQKSCESLIAQRRADSRLNHVIKGLCGGANGLLLGLKFQLEHNGPIPEASDCLLTQVRGMLDEATEWAHKRQFFMQLEMGEYVSTETSTNLRKAIEDLLGLDGTYEGIDMVKVDSNLLLLVVQEALSNARKYRDRSMPITITSRLVKSNSGAQRLQIKISNANQTGLRALSEDECRQAFKPGVKVNSDNPTSDGLGLDNAAVAISAAKGRVWLSTTKNGRTDYTHFHVDVPVTAPPLGVYQSDGRSEQGSETGELPLEDESKSTSSSIDSTIATLDRVALEAARKEVLSEAQLGQHLAKPLKPASKTRNGAKRRPLVCVGVDDTRMLRKMHTILFELFVGANMERSGSVGATIREIEAFADIALGGRDLELRPTSLPQADVAIIDQNLCNDDDETFLVKGEDIARKLRDMGYTGVICMLTGSNRAEVNRLSELPHIDLAFDKNSDLRIIAEHIHKLCHAEAADN